MTYFAGLKLNRGLAFAASTPYVQIGDHKYDKPILDRVTRPDMRLSEAAKMGLPAFDSALCSNLSVGMPIVQLHYNTDSFTADRQLRIGHDDPYFQKFPMPGLRDRATLSPIGTNWNSECSSQGQTLRFMTWSVRQPLSGSIRYLETSRGTA